MITEMIISKRILLVEDETLVAMNEAGMLREAGYELQIAASGEEAVEKVRDPSNRFDLILMDINLGPGMDGTEAAQIILKEYDIPIVFFFSHTAPEEMEKAEKITSYGCVIKNSGMTVLSAWIKMAFKLHATYQTSQQTHKSLQQEIANHRQTEATLRDANTLLQEQTRTLEAQKEDLLEANRQILLRENMLYDTNTALRLSEDKFAKAFRASPVMLSITSTKDGRLVEVNDSYVERCGYSREELIDHNTVDLGIITLEARNEIVRQLKDKGSVHNYELVARTRSGRALHILYSGEKVEIGGQAHILNTMIDITNCKLVEKKLRQGNTLLAQAEELAQIGSWRLDLETGKSTWSDEMYTIFGVDPNIPDLDLIEVFTKSIYPDDRMAVAEATESTIRLGIPRNIDYRIVRPDGKVAWVYTQGKQELDASGQVVAVVGIVQDITERKKAEEALRESEALLSAAGQLTRVGGWEVDSETLRVKWTEQTYHIYEVPPDFQPTLENVYDFYPPEERQRLKEAIHHTMTTGEQSDLEANFVTVTGKRLKARCVWKQYFVDGKFVKLIGVIQDITALRHMEDALKQSLHEKEVLMHELQHRVKNSLMVAASLLAIEEHNLPDERTRAIFVNTQARLNSMSAIYEQLYRSGGIDHVNLRQYMEKLIARLAQSYLVQDRCLKIEAHIEAIELEVKRTMPLGIILTELVTNAIKYAFPAGASGVIRVELTRTGKEAKLCVTDNGVGMPGEIHSGGMGLQLVRMLTHQIRGYFSIEGNQGCTACVVFSLS